jgi:uncharacterized DUF497 family protein
MLIFEWDERKAAGNLRKHGVTFEEAQSVFYDLRSLTIHHPDYTKTESRFIDIGISKENRVLVVVYTERENRIRIISARKATKSERKQYEKDE